MLVVVVALRIDPTQRDRFVEAIATNATAAVRDEPGCLGFDVTQSVDDSDRFVVVERYADEAALEAHRSSPHFLAWREVSDEVVLERDTVHTPATLVHSGLTG